MKKGFAFFVSIVIVIVFTIIESPQDVVGAAGQSIAQTQKSPTTAPTPIASSRPTNPQDALRKNIELAKTKAAQASMNYSQALADATNKVHSDPAYIAAKKKADDSQAELEKLRSTGATDLSAASQQWITDKGVVAAMDAKVADDPTVVIAKKQSEEADAALETLKDASINEMVKRHDAEVAAKQAEQDRIDHLPENIAIKSHELFKGMTYDQALRAMGGKPYSISQSGDVLLATWELPGNEFWSATFENDKATSITHTRL